MFQPLMSPTGTPLPPIAITDDLRAKIAAGAWVVFNLSGGKDSSAALFAVNLALDLYGHPRSRRFAIHADLGRAEWNSTAGTVAAIAQAAGVSLTVVRRAAGDLVDRWHQRFESGKRRYEALETYHLIGPWSSASLRFCQSEMKAAVIGPALVKALRGETIISVLGVRRDESHNRAATPISKADLRHAKAGNRDGTAITLWNPIVDWTVLQVFQAHDCLGIPLHEAYTLWRATRLSCRYCIFASAHDLAASSRAPDNAEVYRELVALEATSTFPFQPARWLADVAPALLSSALQKDVARAKRDQARRLHLEASLPAGLRYVKGWPPRCPTLAEAKDIAIVRRELLSRHGLDTRYATASAVRDRLCHLHAAKALLMDTARVA